MSFDILNPGYVHVGSWSMPMDFEDMDRLWECRVDSLPDIRPIVRGYNFCKWWFKPKVKTSKLRSIIRKAKQK